MYQVYNVSLSTSKGVAFRYSLCGAECVNHAVVDSLEALIASGVLRSGVPFRQRKNIHRRNAYSCGVALCHLILSFNGFCSKMTESDGTAHTAIRAKEKAVELFAPPLCVLLVVVYYKSACDSVNSRMSPGWQKEKDPPEPKPESPPPEKG